MFINEVKQQIRYTVQVYLKKNEYGNYRIPPVSQRPVFLIGPPGIGKSAIMEQIAQEMGIALVSYSMTHHTRQSALGLPVLEKKTFDGQEYTVCRYSMSEIIGAIHQTMEESGIREGILFLDEINCISETLMPSMLQFLQYKRFGEHKVPPGWIVVTAGNPPEYNNSVREFDTVTWDRLKRIDIEPDYSTWKEYALDRGVHPSVSTYLDIKSSDFYKVETTVEGKTIVTARAWLNLSDMIRLYEQNGIEVREKMISQYLQDKKVSKSFTNYYELFNKYKSDYQVDHILSGKNSGSVIERVRSAKYDERLSLLGLILDKVGSDLRNIYYEEQILNEMLESFKGIKSKFEESEVSVSHLMVDVISAKQRELENGKRANSISDDRRRILHGTVNAMESAVTALAQAGDPDGTQGFEIIRQSYNARRKDYIERVNETDSKLDNMFCFAEEAFEGGQEMLIIVTELTRGFYTAHYISRHGCRKYFEHNKELLFYERQNEIIRIVENLDI